MPVNIKLRPLIQIRFQAPLITSLFGVAFNTAEAGDITQIHGVLEGPVGFMTDRALQLGKCAQIDGVLKRT